jgi:hypothetical protein
MQLSPRFREGDHCPHNPQGRRDPKQMDCNNNVSGNQLECKKPNDRQ